ncbi:MlaD family protein [Patulibacter sp. S7RM1-6]
MSPRRQAVPANRSGGVAPTTAGLLLILVIAVAVYFGFTKRVPFKHHYTVNAVVQTSNLIAPGSPVRIAGINVGKVVSTGRYRDSRYAEVTMQIDGDGRPIRRDASIKIRPRLFLEGNFYVELSPGKPGSPEMPDGGVIPISRTAVPVQLDQVLAVLKTDSRQALRQTAQGLGDGFGAPATAAEDASQDPEVHGTTGGEALNATLRTSPQALRDSGEVLRSLRGERKGDLSRAIAGLGDVTEQLASTDGSLVGLVRSFDATVGTTAANAQALTASIRGLATTATTAKTTFAALNAALPPARAAARDTAAAMRQLPDTIDAARPWLAQARPLLGDGELGGLLDDLQPALTSLASFTHESRTWTPKLDAFARCMNEVFLPTARIKVDDGLLSSGTENYKEFFSGMVAQAGEGASFDGNGSKLRIQTVGGTLPIKSGLFSISGLPGFGTFTQAPTGTSPAFTGKVPTIRTDKRCYANGVPDVNGPASRGPADGSNAGAAAPAPLPREGAGR